MILITYPCISCRLNPKRNRNSCNDCAGSRRMYYLVEDVDTLFLQRVASRLDTAHGAIGSSRYHDEIRETIARMHSAIDDLKAVVGPLYDTTAMVTGIQGRRLSHPREIEDIFVEDSGVNFNERQSIIENLSPIVGSSGSTKLPAQIMIDEVMNRIREEDKYKMIGKPISETPDILNDYVPPYSTEDAFDREDFF